MRFYEKEIITLKRSGRYRERTLYDPEVTDLASNDYLGLAENGELAVEAWRMLQQASLYGPKASMLVNGYHPIHAAFEEALCEANGFEAGVVLGSGFNANIAMIESLVRRGDELFIDEKYHASGILATKYSEGRITYFPHNDPEALEQLLGGSKAKRRIIAVEGIYSMDGDMLDRRIIEAADRHEALLIVDEAHSSGVVGPHLMGVFDHYEIAIKPHYIKMGTLGKAYGCFGAYILASAHVVDYLVNRAKPIIYATAPSLFETARGHCALRHILSHAGPLREAIVARQTLVRERLGIAVPGLIVPVEIGDNRKVVEIREALLEKGLLIGAIRQPTVPRAIIRLIARTSVGCDVLEEACDAIAAHRSKSGDYGLD